MAAHYTVRAFAPGDLDALVSMDHAMAIELSLPGHVLPDYGREYFAKRCLPDRRKFRNWMSHTLTADGNGAGGGGAPVGFCICSLESRAAAAGTKRRKRRRVQYVELFWIMCARPHRRRGLARRILARVVADARAAWGDGVAELRLHVLTNNFDGIAFYKRCGFVEVGARKRGYPNEAYDCVRMAKPMPTTTLSSSSSSSAAAAPPATGGGASTAQLLAGTTGTGMGATTAVT